MCLSYEKAVRIVEATGMGVDHDDDLAFTVCGGQLLSGDEAPACLLRMNGWPVQEVARAILSMTGDFG